MASLPIAHPDYNFVLAEVCKIANLDQRHLVKLQHPQDISFRLYVRMVNFKPW